MNLSEVAVARVPSGMCGSILDGAIVSFAKSARFHLPSTLVRVVEPAQLVVVRSGPAPAVDRSRPEDPDAADSEPVESARAGVYPEELGGPADSGVVPSVSVPGSLIRLAVRRAVNDDADPYINRMLDRCQAGDHDAFRELFRNHRGDVARLVHRMLGRSSDLEDIIQEVFLQVYRSIREFRGQSRFSTWIYRITVNVVLMHRRASRSRPVYVDAPTSCASDERAPPDEQVARHMRMEAFNRIIDRLSEKKRSVYILHELEGLAPAEIGQIVGAPVLTVRTRLFYARRELLRWMKEEPALAGLADEFSDIPVAGNEVAP